MRIVFMGTPEFAVPSLAKTALAGHDLVGVVTQPDKKAGRGQHVTVSPVKTYAVQHNFKVMQPEKLVDAAFIDELTALKPDLVVVVAFRLLPRQVLCIPRWGSINLHASLLPKYRGAAPIQWAIAKGEKETGVTVFKLDCGMDTGCILDQRATAIGPTERADSLHDRLMVMGAELIGECIQKIASNTAELKPQNNGMVTRAPKLKKEDGIINWHLSATEIVNRIRAFYPYPGSCVLLTNGKKLGVTRATVGDFPHAGEPGTVICADKKLVVAAGEGAVELVEVQPECKRTMSAGEFMRGNQHMKPGLKFK